MSQSCQSHGQSHGMSGCVLAAPQSGSGKTVLAQGLVRLLSRRYSVLPAKVGPDYIDPQFLSLATGAQGARCVNLDPWAMRDQSLDRVLTLAAAGLDDPLLIVEGVMGLFDGAAEGGGTEGGGTEGGRAHTADLAVRLGLPVVLVVDASRQAGSVAALVQGFMRFRDDVVFAGVILNRIGGQRHVAMLRAALREHCPEMPILGAVPRDAVYQIPQRHLGLVQAEELDDYARGQEVIADHLEVCLDIAALLASLKPVQTAPTTGGLLSLGVQRLAVAYDAAFRFVYTAQLDAWRAAGHEIMLFSPLGDEAPPPDAEAILLPGGYPELHLGTLAGAEQFRGGMCRAAESGVRIHGECGGYMVLGRSLAAQNGESAAMLGLLPGDFTLGTSRHALGYRQVRLQGDHLFGARGAHFRGHEFHYGRRDGAVETDAALFHTQDSCGVVCGDVGTLRGALSGSFVHLIDCADHPTERA